MDPISVAASLVGLLGAAAKVSSILSSVIKSARTAPKLARNALIEVTDITVCLNQLQAVLLRTQTTHQSQESLILVDQVLVILSDCVLIFSELEQTLDPLRIEEPWQTHRAVKWMLREKAVSAILTRLQSSKASLSLIMTTLNCASVGDVQATIRQLSALTTQLIESNEKIFQRMTKNRFDSSRLSWSTEPRSLDVANDDESIKTVRWTGKADGDDASKGSPSFALPNSLGDSVVKGSRTQTQKDEASNAIVPIIGFTFEKDLRASRPYMRASKRYSDCTATSSVAPSMGWSFFSGISLAEVSCLSVIGLPVSPQDLWNGNRYRVATSSPRNHLKDSWQVPGRLLHSMARNLATSLSTVKSLDNYKLSLAGELGIEPKTPNECPRIALFGTSLSGKTTICTHLQDLYDHRPRDHECVQTCEAIVQDLVAAFDTACKDVYPKTGFFEIFDWLQSEHDEWKKQPVAREDGSFIDIGLARVLNRIWANSKIRSAIETGQEAVLNGNIEYFMDHLLPLLTYHAPMTSDFQLRSRNLHVATNSISVKIDGLWCKILDDGGRRLEPHEWIRRFQGLDAMIYVVSLPSYCQLTPGPSSRNAMQESLGLFESLLDLGIFSRLNIYVLLNKVDIFQRMISKVPISDYFPFYTGGADCFNACKFFADGFMTVSNSRKATTHILPMNAVDSESVRDVSLCIRNLLERDLLEKSLLGRGFWDSDSSKKRLLERIWRPDDRITALPWAAMDPDLSRERRTYMETCLSSDDYCQECLALKPLPTFPLP